MPDDVINPAQISERVTFFYVPDDDGPLARYIAALEATARQKEDVAVDQVATTTQAAQVQATPTEPLASAQTLAREIGRKVGAVRTFLGRLALRHSYIRVEQSDRRAREPQYLYRRDEVMPHLRRHFGRGNV